MTSGRSGHQKWHGKLTLYCTTFKSGREFTVTPVIYIRRPRVALQSHRYMWLVYCKVCLVSFHNYSLYWHMQGWPSWVVTHRDGFIHLQIVTHPGSNLPQCRATTVIKVNVYQYTDLRARSLLLSTIDFVPLFVTPLHIASSSFLDGIEPFWPPVLHVALYKTLFLDFWFSPPNAQNLLPKICTKSKIAHKSACMADRPEMFVSTRVFSGMADSMEPCKMLWGRPLLPWQRNLGSSRLPACKTTCLQCRLDWEVCCGNIEQLTKSLVC